MRVEAAEVTKIRVHFVYFAGDQVGGDYLGPGHTKDKSKSNGAW
jgi:hypothetical protein